MKNTLIITFLIAFITSGCGGGGSPSNPQRSVRFNDFYTSAISLNINSTPELVAIGDVNSDGLNDVVMITQYNNVPTEDYKLFVFIQKIDGLLNLPVIYNTNGNVLNLPESIAIGDINNDGVNEVVIGHCDAFDPNNNIEIFSQDLSNQLISSQTIYTSNCNRIEVGDLNNDGLQDLIGIGHTGVLEVYMQNNTGFYDPPLSRMINYIGRGDIDIGDINNDNLNDIVISNAQGNLQNIGILMQQQSGSLSTPTYYNTTQSLLTSNSAIGDVNNDGLNDLITIPGGGITATIEIFFQNPTNQFNQNTTYQSLVPLTPGNAVKIIDINGDNKKDIIVLLESDNTIETYIQYLNSTFIQQIYTIPWTQSSNPKVMAVGDINNDSLPDVVLASSAGLSILYQIY